MLLASNLMRKPNNVTLCSSVQDDPAGQVMSSHDCFVLDVATMTPDIYANCVAVAFVDSFASYVSPALLI